MADDYGEDGVLFADGLPFFLDHDLQVLDSGTLIVVSYLEIGETEKVTVNKDFYDIVSTIIDDVEEDYQELYAIAAELDRQADRLREKALIIEDSDHTVADLFGAEYDD
jgi:hypothetical protein